jgi:hypothetical protein
VASTGCRLRVRAGTWCFERIVTGSQPAVVRQARAEPDLTSMDSMTMRRRRARQVPAAGRCSSKAAVSRELTPDDTRTVVRAPGRETFTAVCMNRPFHSTLTTHDFTNRNRRPATLDRMDIREATSSYEKGMARHIPLVRSDLRLKHACMVASAFAFLQATCSPAGHLYSFGETSP